MNFLENYFKVFAQIMDPIQKDLKMRLCLKLLFGVSYKDFTKRDWSNI